MKDTTHSHAEVYYDVTVVGAGISGINVAYHVQSKLPSLIYTILEGRASIGGTWDLFRYPGIRSDSDLFTFAFAWSPWTENRAIVDGGSIKNYLRTTAEKEGIDKNIQFQHRVVGATAITLLPNLAEKAGYVTMLQRSPTYIMSIDNGTGNSLIHRILPRPWWSKLSRLMFMWTTAIVYYFCRAFPDKARALLQSKVTEQLPKHIELNPHFQPTYRPWDQRLCFAPDGDFFDCMRHGKAGVATGNIEVVTEDAILLSSGQ